MTEKIGKTPSDDRRDEIVLAAFSVLRQNGLPMISYDLIARECGVTRQLVRYYFADPEDLMVALCDHLASVYREALVTGVAETRSTDRLAFFLNFYFDLLEGRPKPRDDQVYDAVMSLATGSKAIRANLRGQYGLLGQIVSHELQVRHPELGRIGADELSYLFVCLMYGHWKMVASLGFSEDHKHITRDAMNRLIQSFTDRPYAGATRVKTWETEANDLFSI